MTIYVPRPVAFGPSMAPRDSRTPGRAPQVTQPLGLSVPVSPVKGVIWTTGPTIPGTLQKIIFGVESHAHFARQGHGRDDGASIPAYCTHDAAGDRVTRHLYGRQCGPADSHQVSRYG